MARLVVVFFRKISIVHFLTVLVDSPVLAVEVDNATLVGSFVQLQIGEVAQGVHISIPNVSSWFERIVVVGPGLENQTLIRITFLDVEHLPLQSVIVPHLVSGDVVKAALAVSIAVVAVLVAVSGGFHPKRAVRVEELDVGQFVVATPTPFAIFLAVATDGNHGNRVCVSTNEKGVGLNETGCQQPAWIDRHSPHNRRVRHVDGTGVQGARRGRRVSVQGVADVVSRRHRKFDRHHRIIMASFHIEQRVG